VALVREPLAVPAALLVVRLAVLRVVLRAARQLPAVEPPGVHQVVLLLVARLLVGARPLVEVATT